ncbi:helix-turn-helix domain-containing protein [Mesorhizobium sp.]|uniref:helix-turn-helix domain-containing protein n=1 Tax=Mesorhizobium sp. TaxID=1871066 RepID=UPI000FE6DAA2|nr:helix-turn-helix domain-containing protein [Mesorhizobium sp.]RWP64903.1 MAG: helix-turn-helix domain-containing protein [Mesorhizobium sp.]
MSHAATKWAFDQPELHRDMKPSEWAVLMVLADCHNPVNGCFPSQDYICSKTNLAERAVRDQLTHLRERGLIDWDAVRENGKRGSNRYRLGFEPDFQPANSAGSSEPAATGEIEPVQPADSDSFNRQNLPPNLVREPVSEPVEREREREPEDRKTVERWLKRVHPTWPTFVADSGKTALAAALALTAEEREVAADRVADYLAAEKASGGRCAFGVYLSEKRWERLGPKPQAPEKPAYAPAFGPVWAAIRMRDLVTGPKAQPSPLKGWEESAIATGRLDRETLEKGNRMRAGWPMVNALHQAAETRGLGIHGYGPDAERLGKLCEFVPVGSDVWKAWKIEHEMRGWPWLPDPGTMRGVYFPAGGPAGLEAFEQAVRGNHDDASGRDAAE